MQKNAEREAELRERERQANALLKLVMTAKKEINSGQGMSPEEALKKLRAART